MLRLRTGFSFRSAAGTVDDYMSRLKEIGVPVAPITDRASAYGYVGWTKAAKKAGLRPVYGIELAVSPEIVASKPVVDYWLFIARESLAPIHRLLEIATQQFRYQPLLSVEQGLAAAAAAADCTVVMGTRPQLTDEQWANPPVHGYIGLSPSTSRGIYRRAHQNGWPFAATSDNRYPRPDDRNFYETLAGRNAELQVFPQHLMDPTEWLASIAHLEAGDVVTNMALLESENILARSRAQLVEARLPVVEKPKTLKQMCVEGAERLNINLLDPVYKARLDRELDMIEWKEFTDYFMIISDLCQWARKVMFVGPARGSSAGSLVCYLLEITTVDPIVHDCIFERFLDVQRGGWFVNRDLEKTL